MTGSDRPTAHLKRQTMAGQVADALRERIYAGHAVEGDKLMQEDLAAEFGVSKVPVREALHLLEAEGLVSQRFHRGAVVAGLTPPQLMELFELRVQIETWLLRLAAENAVDADFESASAMNLRCRDSDDPIEAWDLNWRFHEALYRPSGKPHALDHVRKIHSQTARYVRMQHRLVTDRAEIAAEHDAILQAVRDRDPDMAELLERHILGAAHKLVRGLEAAAAVRLAG